MKILHTILGSLLVMGWCVVTSWGAECPVSHVCTRYGLEDLGLGTGEAAFCQGPGSQPSCFGIFLNGTRIDGTGTNPIVTCPSTTVTTVTGPTATVTIPRTTVTITTTNPTATVTITQPTTTTVTASFDSTPTLAIAPVSVTVTASFNDPDSTYAVSEIITLSQYPPTTTSELTEMPKVTCQPASCAGKTEGIYYHQDCDCRQYYTCITSVANKDVLVLREYRCSGRRAFNPETSECTSDRSVCPYS